MGASLFRAGVNMGPRQVEKITIKYNLVNVLRIVLDKLEFFVELVDIAPNVSYPTWECNIVSVSAFNFYFERYNRILR